MLAAASAHTATGLASAPVSTAMHCRDCQFQIRMVWSSEAETILLRQGGQRAVSDRDHSRSSAG